jgi:hypothetical protein
MSLTRISSLSALLLFAACTTEVTVNTRESGGGGGGGGGSTDTGTSSDTGAGAGPDYQVDATVSGGSAPGSFTGSTETAVEGQYTASVFQGALIVNLASADGTIISFQVDTTGTELPGSVAITGAPPEGTWLTTTGATGIRESSGGAIRIGQCPNTAGTTISGSFENVALNNVTTQSPDGTLSGSFRATVVTSDGSANCAAPVETDTGTVDTGTADTGGGGGGSCAANPDVCTGPCCPYLEPYGTCLSGCIFAGNPFDPATIAACASSCKDDAGITGDAACNGPWIALEQCDAANGCSQLEETPACNAENNCDPVDNCLLDNCCAQTIAVFN